MDDRRPSDAQVVAATIVDAVEQRKEMTVMPGWLAWPARLEGGFPALHRSREG